MLKHVRHFFLLFSLLNTLTQEYNRSLSLLVKYCEYNIQLNIVHRIHCTVLYTEYTVLYSIQDTLNCTVYRIHCTVLYTSFTVLYCIQSTLYCTVHRIHCTELYTRYSTVNLLASGPRLQDSTQPQD